MCWNPRNDFIGLNIFRHHRTCANNGTVPNDYTVEDSRTTPTPDIVSNYGPLLWELSICVV